MTAGPYVRVHFPVCATVEAEHLGSVPWVPGLGSGPCRQAALYLVQAAVGETGGVGETTAVNHRTRHVAKEDGTVLLLSK